jgi:tetratricopeptide (TPR) repeat protein
VLAAARDGRPEARDELVKLAGDALSPAIVRATALSLLGSYPGPEATAAFDRALADDDPLIRYTALSSLQAGTDEEYVRLVTPLLFDGVRAVRIEAAARLAGTPDAMLKPYQRQALAQGLEEYERIMAYSLDFAFAGHNLGNLYTRLGDVARAEQYYHDALEVDDLFYPAKVNLAVLYNQQGRNQEAEQLLREVVRDYPEEYDASYSLGLLLAEMGRVDDAAEFLGVASRGMPDRGRVHYNYGLALQSLGRLPEAESALRQALTAEPDNLDFQFALADHYARQGRWEDALRLADRMTSTHPESQAGAQVRAFVERRRGGN